MYNPNITQLGRDDQKELIKQAQYETRASINYHTSLWQSWDVIWDMITRQRNRASREGKRRIRINENSMWSVITSVWLRLAIQKNTVKFKRGAGQSEEITNLINNLLSHTYEKNDMVALKNRQTLNALIYGVNDMLIHKVRKNLVVPVLMNQRSFYHNPGAISGQGVGLERVGAYNWAGFTSETTKNKLKQDAKNGFYNLTEQDYKDLSSQAPIEELVRGYNKTKKDYEHVLADNRREDEPGKDNKTLYILKHYTYFQGKPVLAEFNNLNDDRAKILRYEELNTEILPFNTRQIYSLPNARNIISIPFLIWDKQNAQEELINRIFTNEIKRTSNIWLYDTTAVQDVSKLTGSQEALVPINGASVKDVMQAIPRSSVEQATSYIYQTIQMNQATEAGSSRQSMGIAGSGYETATSIYTAQQNDNELELAKILHFIEDDKHIPPLIIDAYLGLSNSDFNQAILTTNEAGDEVETTITSADLKKITKDTLGDVIVTNQLLEDRERERKIQLIPYVIQQASLLAGGGANLSRAIEWSFKVMGMNENTIKSILPLNPAKEEAKIENISLIQDDIVNARATQDHKTHIEEHSKEKSTPAMDRHILQHRTALIAIENDPELKAFIQQQRLSAVPGLQGGVSGVGGSIGTGTQPQQNPATIQQQRIPA